MLKRSLVHSILIVFAVLCMNVDSAFAASKKSKKASSKNNSAGAVSIPIPESARKSQEYFSSIPPRIMALIEDGSPHSLKLATTLLHRTAEESYTEKEKILLYLCQAIMQVAWPSQPVTWGVPEFSRSDAYTNTVYSAASGIFDVKIKNEDFLSLVLPSLVVLTGGLKPEYNEKVEASLSKALKLRESSALANYLMGVFLYQKANYAGAFSCFSKALESDGSNKEILLYGLKACSISQDYESALSLGERLLALEPQHVEALKLVCNAYYADGSLDKANEYAAKILTLAPDSFDYVLIRAKIAMESSDYVKVSSLLDAYSRSGSVSKDYYLLRAKLQKEWNKNNNSAAETIGKALYAYPDDCDVMLYAAAVASEANMPIAGCSALELAMKVLQNDSNNRDATKICINELNKAGSYARAYELSNKVVQKSYATIEDFCLHIDICLACRKSDEASKLAKALFAKEPQNVGVQKASVKVLVASGQDSEAEKLINALVAGADSEMKSFLFYEKSFLYGDEASVLENLRTSLTNNPRNSDALYRLYQVYYNKKDWKRAQYYLRQVVALNPVDSNALAKNEELDVLLKK
ncbi:MAG: tetratricopeptide repeat protein [Treponema sp.]|nr:tetratricopeptide repeat protein [Treponema sp.]